MKTLIKKLESRFNFNQKKIVPFFVLLTLFFFVGCNNDLLIDDEELTEPTIKAAGWTDPYIVATFIDFWNGKVNWNESKWNAHMSDLQLVGVETLVVQFASYTDGNGNNSTFFNSTKNYITWKYPNALKNLLTAAKNKGIKVYLGLYFDKSYDTNYTNPSILGQQANRSKELANEIINQVYNGTLPDFEGWYIPQEPAASYYKTQSNFNILKNNLINPVANHCKSVTNKPVSIATYFNQQLSTKMDLLYFMNRIASCNLDVVMLQDGTGVIGANGIPHCTFDNIAGYFNNAKYGLFEETNKFSGEFWGICETFYNNSPETFARVKQKLDIEKNYVTKIVSFQYFRDMGIGSSAANKLRDEYREYYANW